MKNKVQSPFIRTAFCSSTHSLTRCCWPYSDDVQRLAALYANLRDPAPHCTVSQAKLRLFYPSSELLTCKLISFFVVVVSFQCKDPFSGEEIEYTLGQRVRVFRSQKPRQWVTGVVVKVESSGSQMLVEYQIGANTALHFPRSRADADAMGE